MTGNPLSTMEPWDLVSAGYAQELLPVFSQWAQDSFERVRPQPEHRVIDEACGPGTVSLLLASRVKEIVAFDFLAKMLAELQNVLAEKDIANVTARRCDCQSIDEADRSFDLAFSQFGLMFFPDLDAGFAELFRVLKPGGKTAVYSWAPVSESPAMRMVMEAIWSGFPHLRPKDVEQESFIKGLDNRAIFAEKLNLAGFEQVTIEPISHQFRAESALAFWQGVVRSSAPVALLKQESTVEAWQVGETGAIAYLEDAIKGPTELASTALLGVGVRPTGKG